MKKLLSDQQYAQYLADGILVIQPDSLTDDFHDHLFDCAQDLYAMAEGSKSKTAHLDILGAVSYTHLTLPTNREV